MVRGSEAEGDLYGDQASAHWGESAAVFGISPVRDMLPCSHTRDFGVRDAGCGEDWPLMRPIFFYGGCAQAGSKCPFCADGFIVETD